MTPLKTLLLAAVAAFAILILFVLPAETGMDPTGAGDALGLTALAESSGATGFTASTAARRTVEERFMLEPFESIEFKLVMHDGDGMIFDWSADSPVEYEFHAHGPHMAEGEAIDLGTGEGTRQAGTYIADFIGEHGWFFGNRSGAPITIDLSAAGHIDGTILYRSGRRIETIFEEGE